MWTTYSTKDTADVVGLSPSTVRSCVRDGLLDAKATDLPLRFSFQDLKVLRTIKHLLQSGMSIRRVRSQLVVFRSQHPDRSLALFSIDVHNQHTVIRDGANIWRADSGQMVFAFQFAPPQGAVAAIPVARMPHCFESPALLDLDLSTLDADECFALALSSEESYPEKAMMAYEAALQKQPNCTESLINLGRLLAEASDFQRANHLFHKALAIDPVEPTALYNLGVVAQDVGCDDDAIGYYQQALIHDATLAEAHYNLATIFDKTGDARSAIRHINEYRKLSKRR